MTHKSWDRKMKRLFRMLDDIIRESRAYYEMTKESRAEGIEEGREEGKLVDCVMLW